MERIVGYQPMVGTLDTEHEVFISHGAEFVGGPIDPTEAARVEWLDLDSTLPRIARGEIWTAGTIIGLLYALARRNSGADNLGEALGRVTGRTAGMAPPEG